MRLRRLAASAAVLGALIFTSAAFADSGTFSGSVAGSTCGPKNPIQVAAGDTKIDVVATADVAANDITLELVDPNGNHVKHADLYADVDATHAFDYTLGSNVGSFGC